MSDFALRSWVEISLEQIRRNYAAVKGVVGPDVEVMPVVKADGALGINMRNCRAWRESVNINARAQLNPFRAATGGSGPTGFRK